LKVRLRTIYTMILAMTDLITDYILLVEYCVTGETGYAIIMGLCIAFPGVMVFAMEYDFYVTKPKSSVLIRKYIIRLFGFGRLFEGVHTIIEPELNRSFSFLTKLIDHTLETFPSCALQTYVLLESPGNLSKTLAVIIVISYVILAVKSAKLHMKMNCDDTRHVEFVVHTFFFLSDFLMRTIPIFLLFQTNIYAATVYVIILFIFNMAITRKHCNNGCMKDFAWPNEYWANFFGYAYCLLMYANLEFIGTSLGKHITLRNVEFFCRWTASASVFGWLWYEDGLYENEIVFSLLSASLIISLLAILYLRATVKEDHNCLAMTWYDDVKGITAALKNGFDIDSQYETFLSYTLLHTASVRGHIDLVKLLLKNNADIELKTTHNQTPVMLAARYGHDEVVDILVGSNAQLDCVDSQMYTALHLAVIYGSLKVVGILVLIMQDLNPVDMKGRTPLHHAAKRGEVEVVKCLLEGNVDINLEDGHGRTAFATAESAGYSNVSKLLETNL